MRLHAFLAVGSDDAQRNSLDVADVIELRAVHRTRMKGRDLIVVEIGDDERLRGEHAGHRTQAVARNAERG